MNKRSVMENPTLFVQWVWDPNHTTSTQIRPGAEKKSPPSSWPPGRWMKVSRVKNGSFSNSEHVCCFPLLQIWYYKNRFALWSQMACNTSEVKFSLMTMAIANKEPLGLWCSLLSPFHKQALLHLSGCQDIHKPLKDGVITVLGEYLFCLFCVCTSSTSFLFEKLIIIKNT